MSTDDPLASLLDDLEETLHAQGYVPLYDFSWFLRGLEIGLTEDEIHAICLEAFHSFRKQHRLSLRWSGWPIESSSDPAADAEDAEPDFDLNSSGTVRTPLQVLFLA